MQPTQIKDQDPKILETTLNIKYNSVLKGKSFQQAIAPYKIKVIAPASGTKPEEIILLNELPYLNIEMPQDLNSQNIAYHANTDDVRLSLLKEALLDPSPQIIIWTLRGGYGTARLIDDLMKIKKPTKEKILIGFSDITALHLFLSQKWQWKTIHGPGMMEFLKEDNDPANLNKVLDIILKRTAHTMISNLKLLNPQKCNVQKITGKITGGNLTLVQTSLGTPWQIKTNGKILFLEDVGEKGYYIDRALNHLRQAKVLSKVKAIVFGEFCDPRDDKNDFAIQRFAEETEIPVFKTDQFGHGKHNHPIIYQARSMIVKDSNNDLYTLKMQIPK